MGKRGKDELWLGRFGTGHPEIQIPIQELSSRRVFFNNCQRCIELKCVLSPTGRRPFPVKPVIKYHYGGTSAQDVQNRQRKKQYERGLEVVLCAGRFHGR